MFTTKDAALLMSSFSVYKGILHRTVPNAFYRLLCAYDAPPVEFARACLLYTSDAADEL